MSTTSLAPLILLSIASVYEFGIHEIYPHVLFCLVALFTRVDSSPESRAAHGCIMLLVGSFWTCLYGCSWAGLFSAWTVCAGVTHILLSVEEYVDEK